MKFTGHFVLIKFDPAKYRQQLKNHLVQELHAATRMWLQVVAGSAGRVPLWSGMARASLLEISELINGRVVLSPLKAKSRIPRGRALGTATQKTEDEKTQLTVVTDVPHYNIQEYQSGISPRAPWHSLRAGEVAFHSFKPKHLPKPILVPLKLKVN